MIMYASKEKNVCELLKKSIALCQVDVLYVQHLNTCYTSNMAYDQQCNTTYNAFRAYVTALIIMNSLDLVTHVD